MTQREHKYRAWCEDTQKMYYQDTPEIDDHEKLEIRWGLDDEKKLAIFTTVGHEEHYEGGGEARTRIVYPKLNCIFLQFTGLTDKNGKEVYEGDIVQSGDNRGFIKDIWTFEWIVSGGVTKEDLLDPEKPLMQMENIDKAEIIGNIYSNPELT